jgi:hypothetical protein
MRRLWECEEGRESTVESRKAEEVTAWKFEGLHVGGVSSCRIGMGEGESKPAPSKN